MTSQAPLAFHVTTPKKAERYTETGAILPPVRFWQSLDGAERWARRTGRSVILAFAWPDPSHPLPDHRPYSAYWTPALVRRWDVVKDGSRDAEYALNITEEPA